MTLPNDDIERITDPGGRDPDDASRAVDDLDEDHENLARDPRRRPHHTQEEVGDAAQDSLWQEPPD